jgi:hypothetical protein
MRRGSAGPYMSRGERGRGTLRASRAYILRHTLKHCPGSTGASQFLSKETKNISNKDRLAAISKALPGATYALRQSSTPRPTLPLTLTTQVLVLLCGRIQDQWFPQDLCISRVSFVAYCGRVEDR